MLPGDEMPLIAQAASLQRRSAGLRLAFGVLVLLAACEVFVVQLYVNAMERVTNLSVELEYTKGSALIASAKPSDAM
jgi:hypothetical protein